MASAMMMLSLSAIAGCMVVLLFGFSSMHSSLYALQTSFDHQAADLRQLTRAHAELDEVVHRLQKEAQATSQALATQSSAVQRSQEASQKAAADLRANAEQLSELQESLSALTAQQDSFTKAYDELKAVQNSMVTNLTEAQAALDDVRGGSSQLRVWHDQMQSWREQEQRFETETGQALGELREKLLLLAGPNRHNGHLASLSAVSPSDSGENFSLRPGTEEASSDEPSTPPHGGRKDSTTPLLRRKSSDDPEHGAVTPRNDATTRHRTEGAHLAHLALPGRDSTKPRHSSSAPTEAGATSAGHLAARTSKSSQHRDQEVSDSVALEGREAASGAQPDSESSSEAPADRAGGDAPTAPPPGGSASLRISWYRECGCTGMEIEAVTILEGLARSLGARHVRTNRCDSSCEWPAHTRQALDKIELWGGDEKKLAKWLWADGQAAASGAVVLVVHAAFLGVCGLPEFALPLDGAEEEDLLKAVQSGRPGLLRVSRSMLETDRLEPLDVEKCNSQFDAVWVPSEFNRQTFSVSGVENRLLQVLPEALDPQLFNCSAGSPPVRPPVAHFFMEELDRFVSAGVGHDTFTFLSVFKWEERKNWRILLETFWHTFPHGQTEVMQEDGQTVNITVRLLIKTQFLSWGTNPDEDVSELISRLGVSSADVEGRLLVVKDPLPVALVPGLYRAADAFVLPTHGEGWGLPLMEAMATGLPTIATGWGGSTEFMNPGNSILLGYELVDALAGPPGHKWAEPEQTALRKAMEDAVRRSTTSRSIAERACREVPGELYTPDAVAHRIVRELAQAAAAPVIS